MDYKNDIEQGGTSTAGVGDRIVLKGLKAHADDNGRQGTVLAVQDNGHYAIRLYRTEQLAGKVVFAKAKYIEVISTNTAVDAVGVGDRVELKDLVAHSEDNGRQGFVLAIGEGERYRVRLDGTEHLKGKVVNVKKSNIEAILTKTEMPVDGLDSFPRKDGWQAKGNGAAIMSRPLYQRDALEGATIPPVAVPVVAASELPMSHPGTEQKPTNIGPTVVVHQSTSKDEKNSNGLLVVSNSPKNGNHFCIITGIVMCTVIGITCLAMGYFSLGFLWWLIIVGIVFLILSCVFCCCLCCTDGGRYHNFIVSS